MEEQKKHTTNTNDSAPTREQELENQLKRALADYANLKNRLEKEKAEMTKFSNELLLMQMVGILDGLEMASREFRNLLEKNGFTREEIKIGEQFDPNTMEAIDASNNGDSVTEVYSQAYRLHDKVVRPAQVKLGERKEKDA
jgi:molecular chaperone GrpE